MVWSHPAYNTPSLPGACTASSWWPIAGTLYVRCTEDWRANRPAWVPSHRWALEMHLYTGTGADSPSQTVDVARRPEKGFFLAQEKGFPVGQLYHSMSNGYVCSRNTARDSLRI